MFFIVNISLSFFSININVLDILFRVDHLTIDRWGGGRGGGVCVIWFG